MDAWETFEHAGFTVDLYHDDDPGSPREWDNLGEMVHWHRRYELGDRTVSDDEGRAMSRGGFPLLARYLSVVHDAAIVLPLSLLDHSGLTMWIGRGAHIADPGGWDSGTVGFIWVTRARVKEEYGDRADALETAEHCLRAEVSTFDNYLRGTVAGFIIKDKDGEHLDSCWGYYPDEAKGSDDGFDFLRDEVKGIAEGLAQARRDKAAAEVRAWASKGSA